MSIILPESPQWYDGPPLKGIRAEHLADKLLLANHLNPTLLGLAGDLSTINSGDAAAVGTSGRLVDAAHQHPVANATVSALTRTATSTEGSGTALPRNDHGHGVNTLPWGLMAAIQRFTTNNGPHSASGNTDFVFSSLSMLSTRTYKACLHTFWSRASAATWVLELTQDGTVIGEFDLTDSDRDYCDSFIPFTTTTATHTYRVHVNEVSAGGDLTLVASSTAPRLFWIEDIGPVTPP